MRNPTFVVQPIEFVGLCARDQPKAAHFMPARRLRLAIAQPSFFIAIFEFDGFLDRK